MRNIIRFRVLIPLAYLLIIFSSYFLVIIAWDCEARGVFNRSSQKYIIINNTPRNIVNSLIGLSKTDSNYTSFVNPKTKQIEHFDVIGEYFSDTETWRMHINIPKDDIQFIFFITDNGKNTINLSYTITKDGKYEIYPYKSRLIESLRAQRIFETEVLDKVCEYYKCTLFGLITLYSNLFLEYQLSFILVYIILICVSLVYTFFSFRKWQWIIIIISFSLYVSSFFLPFMEVVTYNEYHPYKQIYLISTLFATLSFSNAIFKITLIVHFVYLISIGLYLKGVNVIFLFSGIILVLSMALSMLIIDYWIPSNFINILLDDSNTLIYKIGYYLWVASFVVLLIGMLLTRRIKDKIDA